MRILNITFAAIFVIFALLLGSDYTAGVKGVGLVNAMEILKVFGSLDKL